MKVKVTDAVCDKCGKVSKNTDYAWYLDWESNRTNGRAHLIFCERCHEKLMKLWAKARKDTMIKFVALGEQQMADIKRAGEEAIDNPLFVYKPKAKKVAKK